MPSGLLVLQRFFLRVDDVVFRVFDTRLYVAFEPDSPSTTAPAPAAAPAPGAFPIPTTASFTTSTARPGAAFPTATATARPGAPAPQPGATPAPWQRASGAATPTATARPGATQPTPTPAPTRTSIPTDQPDVSRLSLGPTRRATREAVAATATSAPFGAVPMRDSTGDASDAGEASQGRPEVRVIRECSGCEASYAEVKGVSYLASRSRSGAPHARTSAGSSFLFILLFAKKIRFTQTAPSTIQTQRPKPTHRRQLGKLDTANAHRPSDGPILSRSHINIPFPLTLAYCSDENARPGSEREPGYSGRTEREGVGRAGWG